MDHSEYSTVEQIKWSDWFHVLFCAGMLAVDGLWSRPSTTWWTSTCWWGWRRSWRTSLWSWRLHCHVSLRGPQSSTEQVQTQQRLTLNRFCSIIFLFVVSVSELSRHFKRYEVFMCLRSSRLTDSLNSLIFLQERSPICERPPKRSPQPKRQYPSCSSPTSGKLKMSFMSLHSNSFSLCEPTPSGKRMENFLSWRRASSTKRFIRKWTESAAEGLSAPARGLCQDSIWSHLHWEEKTPKLIKWCWRKSFLGFRFRACYSTENPSQTVQGKFYEECVYFFLLLVQLLRRLNTDQLSI